MLAKTIMFFLGVLFLLVSLIALAISLGYDYSFLSVLPKNPIVYYGIFGVLSLLIIALSRSRTLL